MNHTQKLLGEIVENARMGASACEQLAKKAKDVDIKNELMRQKQVYEGAILDAEKRLYEIGARPGTTPITQRMGAWIGMEFETLTDVSAAHLAEMTIQGATMGVISLTKARSACPDADAQAQGVAAALIEKQQEGIDRLKSYLTNAPVS